MLVFLRADYLQSALRAAIAAQEHHERVTQKLQYDSAYLRGLRAALEASMRGETLVSSPDKPQS